MDWSGVDYCDVFILTAPIHCWDTDREAHFYKPDEETNSSNLGWPEAEHIVIQFSLLSELLL